MMNLEQWHNRCGWLVMVAAILIAGHFSQTRTQAGEDDVTRVAEPSADPLKERPWLGLHCFPADAILRAHVKLPEGQGLVVGSVAPDSPAAKGGIQPNDILLTAAGQPLKEVADLVLAIEQSVGKSFAIELVRGGETKTIEVTPGTRAADAPAIATFPSGDRGVVDRYLERMPRVFEGLPDRIRVFRAGAPVAVPFPNDLTLNLTKEGDKPAKIVVKKGDEQWETTEDKLGALPENIRGPVEVFLGKFPTGGEGRPVALPLPGSPAGPRDLPALPRTRDLEERLRQQAADAERRARDIERRIRDEAGPVAERAAKRVEELEQQLRQRLEKLDRLIEERTRAIDATPPVQPKPATPATPPAQPEPATGPALTEPTEA